VVKRYEAVQLIKEVQFRRMTTGTKLHQCLADAESVEADLKTFSLETQQKQAKAEYAQLAEQMHQTVQRLRAQVNRAEQEEPQYKVRKEATKKAAKQRRSRS
jgi:hypothetical protein